MLKSHPKKFTLLILIIITFNLSANYVVHAQDEKFWSFDGGVTVAMFEQQVKAKIGDPKGQKLIEHQYLGVMGIIHRKVYKKLLYGGVFFVYDFGVRKMANFDGFDSLGKTKTTESVGGTFSEFWLGPVLRLRFNQITADFGYAFLGTRRDEGRTDIVTVSGSSQGALKVNPKVAWFLALGAAVPIQANIDFIIRVEYRVRYYDHRDADPLIDNIEHGTQSLAPFVGVALNF